ncbi:MAG TPA: DNA adenine methylase [Chitinophagaceae bacterium]
MAHYTPLRYPGGKQKLVPFILEVLKENKTLGSDYAEPYAGGAGVACELLLAEKVERIHLNDACRAVYCFWKAILEQTEEFCRRVKDTPLTINEWRNQKEKLSRSLEFDQLELGFSTFYLNRCNRSGILAGSGVIGGTKQNGAWKMDARFPRKDLIKRIEALALKRACISLHNCDAEKFINSVITKLPKSTLVYCDPPYYRQAKRLYLNHYNPEDHARIATVIQTQIRQPWIVSYDGVPEILRNYYQRSAFLYTLQYNASRVYKGVEVFFFSDDLKVPSGSAMKAIDFALKRRDESAKASQILETL